MAISEPFYALRMAGTVVFVRQMCFKGTGKRKKR